MTSSAAPSSSPSVWMKQQQQEVVPVDPAALATINAASYMPKKLEPQRQGITFNREGELLLTTSALTSRYWTSSLFLFGRECVDQAAAVLQDDVSDRFQPTTARVGVELDDGVGDAVFFGPDTDNILVGLDNGALEHLKIAPFSKEQPGENGCVIERAATYYEQDKQIQRLTLSGDGDRIISVGWDRSILMLQSDTLGVIHHLRMAHRDIIWDVSCSTAGLMATVSEDKTLALWNEKREAKNMFISKVTLPCPARAVSFLPGHESLLVIGDVTGSISLYDVRKSDSPLDKHLASQELSPCSKLRFSPKQNNVFALETESCSVRQFSVEADQKIREGPVDNRHEDFVKGIAWNPVDGRLWSCGWDSKIIAR